MSKFTPLATVIGLTTALISGATFAETGSPSFEKLDSDNDGLITPTEGQGVAELEKRWDRFDEDNSGAIDRQEFSALEEATEPSTKPFDFDELDQNNDGNISAIEVRKAPRLQEMWSEIDDDDSGTIDWNEFDIFEGKADTAKARLTQQRFNELDKDRDGIITLVEVRRHVQLRQIWPQVDADDSGAVDRMEFTRWADTRTGTELLSLAPPFERLDEDGNGYITAVEGRDVPLLHNNWSQVDTDNSGAIDRAEFSAFEERLQQEEDASGDMKQGMHEKAKESMQQGQTQ